MSYLVVVCRFVLLALLDWLLVSAEKGLASTYVCAVAR